MNPVRVISILLSVLFSILIIGLTYTQILQHARYANLAQHNRVRLIPIQGQRGRIFDRNNVLLVGNRQCFEVVVIPQELEDSVRTLNRLAVILGIPVSEIFKKVEKKFIAPFAPISIMDDLDKTKAIMVEEEGPHLTGVMVRVTPKRHYKFKNTGSHIFGHLGEIDKDELGRLKEYGYQIKDLIGKSGLEKNYDTYLKGEEGGMQLEVDNRGYFVNVLGKKEALCGKDLYLTIDMGLQEFIENILGDKNAACVAMVPHTGELLALVSKQSFDPDIFISKERYNERLHTLRALEKPMLNRAISGLYPPGSVFKPVIAIAALEKKRITPDTTFSCGGKYPLGDKVFECWNEEGHGTETVVEGLKNSCNVFFYQAGRAVGVEDIYNIAARFGYGTPTGIDLPEESGGLIPNKMWKRLAKREVWFEGDTLNLSIGQGYLLATPLQVVRMTAAIANGGRLVQPYIVKKINNIEVSAGRSKDTGVSEKTLEIIKMALRRVVEDEAGTGRRARVEGLSIAGKTGTAQNPKAASHAWFTGFAPVENPKLVLVVFIEHGGKGGLEAAETAGKIFAEARRLGLL